MDFAVPANPKVKLKKKSKKRDKYLDLARELKKTMEYESDGDTNCNWYSHQKTSIRTGELGNKMTSGEHAYCSIVKIDQNTEKSPGDLRRLDVTPTPVKDYQLTLAWKTFIIMITIGDGLKCWTEWGDKGVNNSSTVTERDKWKLFGQRYKKWIETKM